MFARVRSWLPWGYLLGLLWLNGYLVRHVFGLTYTGATHAMHGYWMAVGRVMGDGWLTPRWVPYWAGGMPGELTYSPLVPWLGWHFGIYAVMAGIFVLGPAAVYLMGWQLSGKPGWAFWAGVVYSLCSPTDLVFWEGPEPLWRFFEPRRMYVTLVWDEAPHQLALALLCLAVAAWGQGWRRTAVGAIAFAALASPFGVTGAALFGVCWALVTGGWRTVAVTGVWAYLIVCPFYPPSLLGVLRANGALAPESTFSRESWLGWGLLLAMLAVVWRVTRKWAPVRRFALLLALTATALPVVFYRYGVVLVQQPGRYRAEMELAAVLLAVFALERVLRRRWGLAAVALLGVCAAGVQTARHRRFARNAVRQADAAASIEAHAAGAVRGVVFTAGSLAHWMNVFGDVRQYSGGSYATTPNPVQQRLTLELMGEGSWEKFVVWMQAVGVDEVIIPGKESPEFWKPFARDVLAGHLQVRWEERDTRLYAVPRVRRTMVHSVPGELPLEAYVTAMEDAGAPELQMEWRTPEAGVVRGRWRRGDWVVVHMNWHPGWRAAVNGKEVATRADGLGQLVVVPGEEAGELELRYSGRWEGWASRGVSLLAVMGLLLWRRKVFT